MGTIFVDKLFCTPGTNITLYVNYPLMQKKKKKQLCHNHWPNLPSPEDNEKNKFLY